MAPADEQIATLIETVADGHYRRDIGGEFALRSWQRLAGEMRTRARDDKEGRPMGSVDDEKFARTIALVFRKLLLLQTTVHALGRTLRDRNPDFEREYDAHREAMLPQLAPLLAAIEAAEARADAAELLEMLKRFNLPLQ